MASTMSVRNTFGNFCVNFHCYLCYFRNEMPLSVILESRLKIKFLANLTAVLKWRERALCRGVECALGL